MRVSPRNCKINVEIMASEKETKRWFELLDMHSRDTRFYVKTLNLFSFFFLMLKNTSFSFNVLYIRIVLPNAIVMRIIWIITI